MFELQRNAVPRADREEMLRYAGYAGQELDEAMSALADTAIEEAESIARPSWCFQVFPSRYVQESGELSLEGSIVRIPVESPNEAFAEAVACAVLACTIGASFDRDLGVLGITDGPLALLCDTAGSSIVENACDECEQAIGMHAQEKGLYAGQRFSPGYTGIPLALSRDLLNVLQAHKRLGISLTDSGMLVPMKSVTAFVPLFEDEGAAACARRTCAGCSLARGCDYLRQGITCYKNG